MPRYDRIVLTAGVLAFSLSLSACSSSSDFDPRDLIPTNLFGMGKKPLPGERRPVFPEGTPGVPQGVPQELQKGYQAPAEETSVTQPAAPAKPKAAPQRAKPKTASAAQPRPAAPKQSNQSGAGTAGPDPSNQNAWPPPDPNTFSR